MSEERKITNNITIENAKIIFKNFQGREGDYNKAGDRNFGVLLNDDDAEIFARDGWPVKYLKPQQDDPKQYRQPWMPVKVRFGKFPPIAALITSRGKTKLTEETIGQIDSAYIKNVDLIIRPYNYPATPYCQAGVSAYLKAIYVTIYEDELTLKYGDIPDMEMDVVHSYRLG